MANHEHEEEGRGQGKGRSPDADDAHVPNVRGGDGFAAWQRAFRASNVDLIGGHVHALLLDVLGYPRDAISQHAFVQSWKTHGERGPTRILPRQTTLTGGIHVPKARGRARLEIGVRVTKSDATEHQLPLVALRSPRQYELHVRGSTFELHVSVPGLHRYMWRRVARMVLPTKGGLPAVLDALRYASVRDGAFLRFVAHRDAAADIGIALALWDDAVGEAIASELARDRRATGTSAQIRWRLFMALSPSVRKELGRRQQWGGGPLLPTLATAAVKPADAIDRRNIVTRLLRPAVRERIAKVQRERFGIALDDGALVDAVRGTLDRAFKARVTS